MSYTPNDKPKLALLIDADNISAKYLSTILNEIPRHGIATYRRIYGDFTDNQMASWRKQLLDNSIQPVQQFSNVKNHKKGEKAGKNATDSTLIIDAMDILYAGKVDGFIIVSSDSDFTRLAQRLRESNMIVVGMGRNQTSISFRHACTKFVNIESLYDMASGKKHDSDASDADSDDIETTVTLKDVEIVIAGIIRDNDNNGRTTTLAEVGASLSNKFPDFDVRSFGYTQLSKMIEEFRRFDMTRTEVGYDVSIRRTDVTADKVLEFIVAKVAERRNKTMSISALAGAVYEEYPDFNIKDEGYSQFYKFAGSAPQLAIIGNSSRRLARLMDEAEQAALAEEQAAEEQEMDVQAEASDAAEAAKPEDQEAAEDKQEDSPEAPKSSRRRRRRNSHKVENAAEETTAEELAKAPAEPAEETAAEPENADVAAEQPAEETPSEKPKRRNRNSRAKVKKEEAEQVEQAVAEQPAEEVQTAEEPPAKKTRRKSKGNKTKDEQKPSASYGEIYAFMVSELEKAKENTMGMAPLATKVKKRFPEFDLAATGYKQFYQFANNCLVIAIVGEGRGRKATLSK